MIKIEFFKTRNDGVNLYRIYSDNNFIIKKIGTEELYDEAIDVEGIEYKYEETNDKIESEVNKDEQQNL